MHLVVWPADPGPSRNPFHGLCPPMCSTCRLLVVCVWICVCLGVCLSDTPTRTPAGTASPEARHEAPSLATSWRCSTHTHTHARYVSRHTGHGADATSRAITTSSHSAQKLDRVLVGVRGKRARRTGENKFYLLVAYLLRLAGDFLALLRHRDAHAHVMNHQ